MASERQLPALRVELRASGMLTCTLALAHLAAVAALFAAVPQWHWRALAATALLASACWTLRRHALLLDGRAVSALEFRGETQCAVAHRDASHYACEVQPSSYVSTWLIVLHLKQSNRGFLRYVVIAPDSVAADRFRRLRVRLRWNNPHAIGGEDAPL